MQINSRNDLHVVASNYRHQLIEGYTNHQRIFRGVLRDVLFHPEESHPQNSNRILVKRFRPVATLVLEDIDRGTKSHVQVEQGQLGALNIVSLLGTSKTGFIVDGSIEYIPNAPASMPASLKIEEPKPLNVYEIAALVFEKNITITNLQTKESVSGKVTEISAGPDPYNHTQEATLKFGRLGVDLKITSSDIRNNKYSIDIKEVK